MPEITFAQAIREAMCEEMRLNPDVFLMGEDIGVYGGVFGVSKGMFQEFGERIVETPISELGFVGAGVGAALSGMRPIVEVMFSDFLTIAFDQIVNQAAKMRFMSGGNAKVPLVIRASVGSGTGAAAQHSQSPEAWLANVPGLIILAPSTPFDAKGLLKAAVRDDNPVVFLEPKLLYRQTGHVPDDPYILPIGKAKVRREGNDITVITYGRMVQRCLDAAEMLGDISLEVIDLRTLSPLDHEAIIASVRKTRRAMIVHEAPLTGGLGGEIAAVIASSRDVYPLKAPITRCCGMDVPVPFAKALESAIVPDAPRLAAAARQMV